MDLRSKNRKNNYISCFDNPDSYLPNKKSSSDISGEDCNVLIASRYKGSPGSKKTTKDKSLINLSKSIKLPSPRKKAATALYQEDDDSPSASQLSRGSSTLSRKDNVAMPMFGNEPVTKIKRSNSSFKKGMFDGLHDDKSRVDASGAKFKFNFEIWIVSWVKCRGLSAGIGSKQYVMMMKYFLGVFL